MKKIFYTIWIFAFIYIFLNTVYPFDYSNNIYRYLGNKVYAFQVTGGGIPNESGGGCSTPDAYCSGTEDSPFTVGRYSTQRDRGNEFIAQASGTICSVTFEADKTEASTCTTNFVAKIYASDGGSPALPTGAALGTSSSIQGTDFPSSVDTVTFTGLSVSVTATTHYFVVIEADAVDVDNYIEVYLELIGCDSTGSVENAVTYNSGTTTWSQGSGIASIEYEIILEDS